MESMIDIEALAKECALTLTGKEIGLWKALEEDRLRDILVALREARSEPMVRPVAEVLVPQCETCYANEHRHSSRDWRPADIFPDTWREDLQWLGASKDEIQRFEQSGFSVHCCHDFGYSSENVYAKSISFGLYFSKLVSTESRLRKRRPEKWMRLLVFDVYGKKCVGCGQTEELTIDHIQPFNPPDGAELGLTLLTNLEPLCFDCNQKKDNTVPEEELITLHFPLLPPPSDAWEGPAW